VLFAEIAVEHSAVHLLVIYRTKIEQELIEISKARSDLVFDRFNRVMILNHCLQ